MVAKRQVKKALNLVPTLIIVFLSCTNLRNHMLYMSSHLPNYKILNLLNFWTYVWMSVRSNFTNRNQNDKFFKFWNRHKLKWTKISLFAPYSFQIMYWWYRVVRTFKSWSNPTWPYLFLVWKERLDEREEKKNTFKNQNWI